MTEEKIETIGLAQAGPVTPAKPVEKPISKEEQRIKDLEADLAMAKGREVDREAAFELLEGEKEDLERDLKAAQTEAADRRGAYKVQKAEADALKVQLAADPNLAELAALRAEVASLHKLVNLKEAGIKDALIQADVYNRRAKEQEQKNVAIMGTLSTMQVARDAAQARESAAYKKLSLVEFAFGSAQSQVIAAKAADAESCARLKDVHIIHQRGHPEPTAGCALCVALGREVLPAAAPVAQEVAKP
jgi:chromosome segregation ATPase